MNKPMHRLDILTGEWDVEISGMSSHTDKNKKVTGSAVFKWLELGPFLVQQSRFSDPDFPAGTEIIGVDDTNETGSVLYSDARGVVRIYKMSLDNGIWKMWRTAPGFSQRFSGTFSDDHAIIRASWENSQDGVHWEHDFDLTYTKVK